MAVRAHACSSARVQVSLCLLVYLFRVIRADVEPVLCSARITRPPFSAWANRTLLNPKFEPSYLKPKLGVTMLLHGFVRHCPEALKWIDVFLSLCGQVGSNVQRVFQHASTSILECTTVGVVFIRAVHKQTRKHTLSLAPCG